MKQDRRYLTSRRALVLVTSCVVLLAGACSSSNEPVDTATPTSTVPAETSRSAVGDSEYLFDQGEVRTFELTLDPELLAEIDADPTAEEWVTGSLSFEDETIEGVGIRYKGSIGAFVGCVDGPNLLEPSGAKTCTKLSMKVKINETESDLEFYGQRKLQFHAMNLDETKMHERLGYWLFREMGVPAPRAVHARLIINGEFAGLFVLVEQIDGRFTRANYDDGTGNLYKEVWPFDVDGEIATSEALEDGLKTNEDDAPSFAIIQDFASDLAKTPGVDSRQVIEKYMNVDEVLAYIAVDRTIQHDDGPFHWYCFEECEPHNFYLYENPTTETIHLIPWDLDNAFENIDGAVNPVTPIADGWTETRNDCAPFAFGGFGLVQRSAACDPLIAAWTQFDDEYSATLESFLDGPFAEENVNALLDEWTKQIEAAMAEADEAHSDAPSLVQWAGAVDDLRDDLDFARTNPVFAIVE